MEYVQANNGQVLYYDTDSVIYVSRSGDHLIPPDTTGDLGEWSSELPLDDYIVEFASAGPKTYAIKTASGKHDISKSKGFSLHYKNQQVFNFDSLKEQAICKGLDQDITKLQLHLNETIMRRKKFEINVEYNKGKVINMTYDKRFIVNPQCEFEDVTIVNTLPFGHIDLDMLSLEY
jgi:hypothetical protein